MRDSLKINAWNRYECFPINQNENQTFIYDYDVIEINFEGTHGYNEIYNEILASFYSFLKEYLFFKNANKHVYIYSVSTKKQKNKIRSYKGIFPRSLTPTNYLEEEFDLGENISIIAGIAKVSSSNFDCLRGLLSDRSNNFLILTDSDDLLSIDNIKNITSNAVDKANNVINYLKICELHLSDKDIIIREAGDGGDQEFSWQFWVKKTETPNIISNIENIRV